MKFMSNEEGRCPICNSQMIEYFGMELEDTAVYFPWHCPDCDTDGKEWYYVNFSEVRSNDDNIGEEEGVCPDCGAEIEYGTAEPDGNSLGYEYFCPECENSGREWYDLDFDSHTIDGHDDEKIEMVKEARNPKNDEINAKIRSALFGSTKYNKDLEDAGFILDTYGPKNKVNSIHYKDNDKYLYRGKMYNSNKDTDYYNYLTKKSPITWSEKTTNLSNAYGNVSSKKDVTTNGEYFSNGLSTVVGKAMPKRFKTNKSSVMVTEPYGSETIEKYKKFNDTIASKKSDLQDNRNNLQNDIAEKQNNINNAQKEIDQLEKDKQDLIANKKAKSNQQNNINKKQEDVGNDEAENDINLEDTISLLDIALKEIPTIGVEEWGKDDELLFTADTKVMFENLKDYEEEIPKYYYDNASNDDWSNGIDSYLDEIKGVNLNNGDSDNTYNWNAPLTHDVEFTMYEADDGCYFKGSIHRAGDVRGNYTTEFLLKFDSKDDCLEALFDACSENCYRSVNIANVEYIITPHFFDEYVNIWCPDTQESVDSVYCDCIDKLKEIIKQHGGNIDTPIE